MKKIFISYSDIDKNKMKSLQRIINETDYLNAIVVADNKEALTLLSEKVKTGIINCDYFVPILTKNSIYTQWINQEIGFATALLKTIIPITEKKNFE